jgi:hypothetical protein
VSIVNPQRTRHFKAAALAVLCAGVAAIGQVAWSAKQPEALGGPAVMRRLTESQYRATIADVFAPDIPIVGRFERALRADGLISLATSEAGMSAFAIEQYDASARGVAAEVVSEKRRDQLVPCKPATATKFDQRCAQQFVEHYGIVLFRRPLEARETKHFVQVAQQAHERLGNFYTGLQYALAGMLVEPDFLLRIERVERDPRRPGGYRLDAYSRATRLSYFLTDSTPDRELLRAAGAGELDTPEGLAKQVDRLMASPRLEYAVRAFFADMLQFDQFEDVDKDPVIYPVYNSTVALDAQEQTLRTIVDHLLKQDGDYRDLFTTRKAFLTRALGRVYGVPVATRHGWEEGEFPPDAQRAGILTHASFLALYSHPGRSSPTLRGRAVRENFMCIKVPDPPPDVNFSDISLDSTAERPTARDRLQAHRSQPVCAGCHVLMDPVGLTLERYDGVGSFRTHEGGAVIDVSGELDGVAFEGAEGLGKALHDNPLVTHCIVNKMFRSAVGRELAGQEHLVLEALHEDFANNGYRIPHLMRAIALHPAFYAVSAPPGKEPVLTQRAEDRRTEEKS